MITSSDKEYQRTKAIKLGKAQLKGPFLELAQWISDQKNVVVINIEYDKVIPDNRPRLQIMIETIEDKLKFQESATCNFIKKEQDQIAEKFKDLLERDGLRSYDTDRMFVVFSAFQPIAKEEANSNLPQKHIELLIKRVNDSNLWKIERCFGTVIFFYTNDQLEESKKNGTQDFYINEYFKIIKKYDEFKYIKKDTLDIRFDSKENFDKNYNSSWFYYWR